MVSDADFVVDQELFARIADMKRWTLILSGGLLEGAVTHISAPISSFAILRSASSKTS